MHPCRIKILDIQKSIGFRYIRCKGVVDDDMMLYSRDVNGNSSFNYVYLDSGPGLHFVCGSETHAGAGAYAVGYGAKKVQVQAVIYLASSGIGAVATAY